MWVAVPGRTLRASTGREFAAPGFFRIFHDWKIAGEIAGGSVGAAGPEIARGCVLGAWRGCAVSMTGNRHFAAPEVRSGPFWAMPDAALQVKKASCLKMAHICLLSVFCSLDVS